jgi:hypothetical protein
MIALKKILVPTARGRGRRDENVRRRDVCGRAAGDIPQGRRGRGSQAVVDECAAAGVKSLLVISAGFAEVGDAGRALQQQLVERVR